MPPKRTFVSLMLLPFRLLGIAFGKKDHLGCLICNTLYYAGNLSYLHLRDTFFFVLPLQIVLYKGTPPNHGDPLEAVHRPWGLLTWEETLTCSLNSCLPTSLCMVLFAWTPAPREQQWHPWQSAWTPEPSCMSAKARPNHFGLKRPTFTSMPFLPSLPLSPKI